MKKVLIVSLVVASVLLTACGTKEQTTATSKINKESETKKNNKSKGKKSLVVYFSPANSDTADAVSSATPKVDGKSSVEYIASVIKDETGSDSYKIIPTKAYPTDYDELADQAKEERDKDQRPEFKLDVNPEDYDTIFVGYPIWWYQMPMIMDSFFDKYNFDGKTIVPFNTHEGSGDGGTYDEIKKLEPKATVKDGFNEAGDDVEKGDTDKDVKEWLEDLGL